ncbi:MAG TPA: hypothetical protein DEF25_04375 [Thermoanaerobacter sp.]|nr:hypothetical protein [Thermoanaerobacter sp.]
MIKSEILLGNLQRGIGSTDINAFNFNPYSLISFTRQGNVALSFLLSCLICLFWLFVLCKKSW